jgi:hypothetical protein
MGLYLKIPLIAEISNWIKMYVTNYYSFFAVVGLELRAYTLSHSTSPFCVRYFQDRVSL